MLTGRCETFATRNLLSDDQLQMKSNAGTMVKIFYTELGIFHFAISQLGKLWCLWTIPVGQHSVSVIQKTNTRSRPKENFGRSCPKKSALHSGKIVVGQKKMTMWKLKTIYRGWNSKSLEIRIRFLTQGPKGFEFIHNLQSRRSFSLQYFPIYVRIFPVQNRHCK